MRRFIYLFLILLNLLPSTVGAITEDELDTIEKGTYFYGSVCTSSGGLTPGTLTNVDRFLQVLAKQESNGNPKAQNKVSSASGKYQYIDSTWKARGTLYGPAKQYTHAKDAPEEVQDAVAYLEYTQKFNNLGGDVFKLAVSHYYPAALTNPSKMDVKVHGLSPREYANKVVDKINKGEGSEIVLKYLDAPDFSSWLSKIGGATVAAAASAPNNGCGVAGGIPTGDFVFYSQYDNRWKSHLFGKETVAEAGCGPSSVAMIVATLVDSTVTPVQVADYGSQNGGYVEGQGSSYKMLTDGPAKWGLKSVAIGTDMDAAIEGLGKGGLVLASGNGPSPFTNQGHILVIRGVTSSGKLLLGDPAHEDANVTEYDRADLLKSIKDMWVVSK